MSSIFSGHLFIIIILLLLSIYLYQRIQRERIDALKLFLSIPKSTVQLIANKGDQLEDDEIDAVDDDQRIVDNMDINTGWNGQSGNGYSLVVRLVIQVTYFESRSQY